MNHYKRTAYILFALLFGAVFSCAAQKDSSKTKKPEERRLRATKYKYKKRTLEEKARYFTKKMVDNLEVSEAQEDSLYQMNVTLTQKFDSLRLIVNTLDKKERSAAYRAIYAYRDSCMRRILPRKEFLKFLDIERERWERKKAKRRKGDMKKEE